MMRAARTPRLGASIWVVFGIVAHCTCGTLSNRAEPVGAFQGQIIAFESEHLSVLPPSRTPVFDSDNQLFTWRVAVVNDEGSSREQGESSTPRATHG